MASQNEHILPETLSVRAATALDRDALARIYNHYILNTVASFAEEPVTEAEIEERMQEVASAGLPWLVAERDGRVVGYAHAIQWKGRCAYRFSAEVSVYIEPGHERQGVGSALYDRLLAVLRDQGIHTVIGGIALPNEASVALHEKFGFEKVAHFKEVGFKFGRRVDVGYWQRTL